MKATPTLNKITIKHWLCNGNINPLIRTYEALQASSKGPDDFSEALRHIAIDLNKTFYPWKDIGPFLTEWEKRELFREFLEKRSTPSWRKMPALEPGIWTTAQYIAKYGGRNAQCDCQDFEDFQQCLKLDRQCNNFDPYTVARQFKDFNRKGFYNDDNPNNWHDAFTYTYSSNGPTIYVRCGWLGRTGRVMEQQYSAPYTTHWHEFTLADFEAACTELKPKILADESGWASEDTWRFWWD